MSASKIVLRVLSISMSALSLILVVFLLYKVGLSAYDFGYRVFTEKPVASEPEQGQDVTIEIKSGMSAAEIGQLLETKKLIDDKNLFIVQLKLSSFANKIKPGIYTLNTSLTAYEMMEIMSAVEESGSNEEKSNTEKEVE